MSNATSTAIAVITTLAHDSEGEQLSTRMDTVKVPTRRPQFLDGLEALEAYRDLEGFTVHAQESGVWDEEEGEYLQYATICDMYGRPVVDMGYDPLGAQEVLAYFLNELR